MVQNLPLSFQSGHWFDMPAPAQGRRKDVMLRLSKLVAEKAGHSERHPLPAVLLKGPSLTKSMGFHEVCSPLTLF